MSLLCVLISFPTWSLFCTMKHKLRILLSWDLPGLYVVRLPGSPWTLVTGVTLGLIVTLAGPPGLSGSDGFPERTDPESPQAADFPLVFPVLAPEAWLTESAIHFSFPSLLTPFLLIFLPLPPKKIPLFKNFICVFVLFLNWEIAPALFPCTDSDQPSWLCLSVTTLKWSRSHSPWHVHQCCLPV